MRSRITTAMMTVLAASGGVIVAATPAFANTCATAEPMGTGTDHGTATVQGTVGLFTQSYWWEHRSPTLQRIVTLTPVDGAVDLEVWNDDCSTQLCADADVPTACAGVQATGSIRIKVTYDPTGGTSASNYSLTATGSTPTECSDGDDNDNDNATDYPADPHCTSYDDNTEAPVNVAAYGHITISTNAANMPTLTTTGVYADPAKYDCDFSTGPVVEAICVGIFDPEVAYHCSAFILTATAPSPSNTNGSGDVRGRVSCNTGPPLETGDVHGTGTSRNSRSNMGIADVVRCRAAGIGGGATPTGSYQVDCYEPGFVWPLNGSGPLPG